MGAFLLTKNNKLLSAQNIFIVCVALFPIFTLSLHRWISVCLFIAFFLSIYILIKGSDRRESYLQPHVSPHWLYALVIALAGPVIAIALGQIFRQEFIASSFDGASRFLLVIPIALVIIRKKIDVFGFLQYAAPAAILATGVSVLINPNFVYGVNRITSYFVDPLTFGSICLGLALVSLVSIDTYKSDPLWAKIFKLIGFGGGLYLSFLSGSRTGWLAIPIVLWLWLRFRKNIPHWAIFAIVTIFCAGIYFSMPAVQARINVGMYELLNYEWNSLNPDGSVGMRISFFRIGLFVFSHNPLGGWGDTGFKHLLDAAELRRFATDTTRNFTFQAGFHNEIITSMVRSGIWGLLSSLSLFIVPLALFFKGLRSQSMLARNHAMVAISYLISVIVSGMSTEVFNLKFTASFHALMIGSLAASLMVLISSEKELKKS